MQCPACGASARIPRSFAGRRVRCPQCAAEFRVADDASRLIGTIATPPAPSRKKQATARTATPPPVRRSRKRSAPATDIAESRSRTWWIVACVAGFAVFGTATGFLFTSGNRVDIEEIEAGAVVEKDANRAAKPQQPAKKKPAPDKPPKPVIRDGDRLVQLNDFDEAGLKGLKIAVPAEALKQKVTVSTKSKPLLEVLQQLAETHRIPIVIDTAALDDEGIPLKKWPMTVNVKNVTLNDAFDAILGPLQLTLLVPDPAAKAVIITSEVKAAGLDANALLKRGIKVGAAKPGNIRKPPAKPAKSKPKRGRKKPKPKLSAPALVRKGKRLLTQRKADQAIAEFNKALRIRRNDIEALFHRGRAWLVKGNNDKAVADFTAVIKRRKTYRPAYEARALAYLRLGRRESARVDRTIATRLRRRKKK